MTRRTALLALALLALPVSAEKLTETTVSAPKYVCTARSLLGRRFSATGDDEVLTQEEAMRRCEASAARCIATGCQLTEQP